MSDLLATRRVELSTEPLAEKRGVSAFQKLIKTKKPKLGKTDRLWRLTMLAKSERIRVWKVSTETEEKL
jgi:hypothetical protein